MARVQLIDPNSGQIYSVDDNEAEAAQARNGLIPATPEQVADFQAAQAPLADKAGGAVKAGFSELVRTTSALTGAVGLQSPEEEAQIRENLYSPESLAERRQSPIATMVGGAAPLVPLTVATGGMGLLPTAGVLAGEAAVAGGVQEEIDSRVESREFSGQNFLRNSALNLLFSGGALAMPVAARAVLRSGQSTLSRVAARTGGADVARAAAGGRGLVEASDAARSEVLSRLTSRTEQILTEVDDALSSVKAPKVANNPNAQRAAIDDLADGIEKLNPSMAGQLRSVMRAGPTQRLQALRELQAGADPDLAESLAKLAQRNDLWGDAAIAHADALDSVRGLRPSPNADVATLKSYADGLRKVGLDSKADDIDFLVDEAAKVRVAEGAKSVGAMAANDETISPETISHFLRDEEQILDDVYSLAGGAPGTSERGAVQELFDFFRQVTNNRTKRLDFAASVPDDPNILAALDAERLAVVDEMAEVANTLDSFKAKSRATAVRGMAEALQGAEPKAIPGLMDQSKQLLDRLHMKAIGDKTDQIRSDEILAAVDGVANRLRGSLENPQYVGLRNATLQAERNFAWSDPESGFLRNIKRAETLGVKLMKKLEVDYHTGDLIMEFDPAAMKQLASLDVHEAKPVLQAWASVLDSMERMAQSTVEIGAPSAAKTPTSGLLERIQDMRAIFATLDTRLTVKRMTSQGLAGTVGRAVDLAGSLPFGVGDVIQKSRRAGVLEGVEASIKSRVARPVPIGSSAASRSRLRRALAGTGAAAALGVSGVAGAAEIKTLEDIEEAAQIDRKTTARLLVHPDQAEKYLRVTGGAASAIDIFKGEHETLNQAFEERRAMVQQFQKNPMALLDLLTDEFGDLDELSPALFREVSAQALKVSQYLQAKMPGQRNVSVAYPNGTPPSPLEIRQYALVFTAATDPSSVLADAKAGKLRREQVETLKALWPQEYDGLRNEVLEQLGQGSSTVVRQRMNLLFDFGQSVDPALGPRVSALVAAARAKQPKVPPSTPALTRASPPSKAGLTPGGMASLQLGSEMDR